METVNASNLPPVAKNVAGPIHMEGFESLSTDQKLCEVYIVQSLVLAEVRAFREYVESMNAKVAEMASPDNLMKMAEKFLAPGPGGF